MTDSNNNQSYPILNGDELNEAFTAERFRLRKKGKWNREVSLRARVLLRLQKAPVDVTSMSLMFNGSVPVADIEEVMRELIAEGRVGGVDFGKPGKPRIAFFLKDSPAEAFACRLAQGEFEETEHENRPPEREERYPCEKVWK